MLSAICAAGVTLVYSVYGFFTLEGLMFTFIIFLVWLTSLF